MPLSIHLTIHIILSFLAGFYVYKKFHFKDKKYLYILLFVAFLSGVLVDLDHLFDYFIAFGPSFNLRYFLRGYEFLKNDRIFIIFHGFEYVFILFFVYWHINNTKKKAVILTILLALLSHLLFDTYTNELPVRTYFITNRLAHSFELKYLVYPEHYQQHLKQKERIKF